LKRHPAALHAILFYKPSLPRKANLIDLFEPIVYSSHKIRLQTLINERQDSFKLRGRKGLDSFTMIQKPFAIVVGGTLDAPWVEIVNLLDSADAGNDFHTLLAADKRLVQSCATQTQLFALFHEGVTQHRQVQHSHQRQLTMYSEYACRTVVRAGSHDESDYSKIYARMEVDAQIRLVSSNLVERSLVLFVAFMKEGEQVRTQPNWWEFRSQGTGELDVEVTR
jgi:hypothetical protein